MADAIITKAVAESFPIGFEVQPPDLEVGQTISSCTAAVLPSGLTLSGAVTIDGDEVSQLIAGGTAGVDYTVTFTVNTSAPATFLYTYLVQVGADTVSLVTRASFKSYAGLTLTDHDTEIDLIIESVSKEFARYLGVSTLKAATSTNLYIDGNGKRFLPLPGWPAASLGSVYEDDTLLVEGLDEDFVLKSSDSGAWLEKVNCDGYWSPGVKTIKLSTVILGFSVVPSDLQLACMKQAGVEYQRMFIKTWGESSRSRGDSSASYLAPGLLPDVKAVLDRYRMVHI